MECYYNTLKTELIYQYHFETIAELDYAVSAFTNEWYNQVRPHSYNEYPTSFEKKRSVPSSSGVIKNVDRYNYDSISSERAIARLQRQGGGKCT